MKDDVERIESVLASGGGGGHDPGMEARMSAMEQRLDGVESRLEKIDGRLHGVEIKLGEVAGTLNVLVGKIPSWWQQPVGTAGLLTVILAAIGLMAHFHILAVGSP